MMRFVLSPMVKDWRVIAWRHTPQILANLYFVEPLGTTKRYFTQ